MADTTPTRRFGFLMYHVFEELDLVAPWEMATMWRDYAGGPQTMTAAHAHAAARS